MQFSTVANTVILALAASVSAAPIPVNVQEVMIARRAAFEAEL